jgi:hypothetical protein
MPWIVIPFTVFVARSQGLMGNPSLSFGGMKICRR